jgi:aryl-alcohol dehydrogenase-like predicted oxidoreductase
VSSLRHKLGLGTVQFGLAYGVTNPRGQVARADVAAILAAALAAGVDLLDTAAAYGESEAVLGALLPPAAPLRLVSKLPAIDAATIGPAEISACRASVRRSLARLRRPQLYGLLLHRADDLLKPGGDRLVALLRELKEAGLVAKVGVSAYERRQLDWVLAMFTPDLLQVPASVIDQRLLRDGTLARLRAQGIEIHARSVFLQGVLLADPAQLPAHFAPWRDRLRRLAELAERAGRSRLSLCLAFALARPEIDGVVVGVTGLAELQEILAAAGDSDAALPAGLDELAVDDPQLVNPALWPAVPAS